MRAYSWMVPLAAAAVLGCASDESVVCDRLSECDLMPEGLSAADCEDQASRQVPPDRLERCAECVEEHDCKDVLESCGNFCEPGD
jgi:hypothetical protein